MAGKEMPKLNLQQDASQLTQSQLDYMKRIERQNLERVRKLSTLRKKNISLGLTLGAAVLAIYGYSIYSVKQEKFLDELE